MRISDWSSDVCSSDLGGRWDGDARWDRAVGPMQFIPGTWKSFGVDGSGDGLADPNNVFDAATAAARYLCHGGNDRSTRSEERRVGKECVSTCRSRRSPYQ